MIGNSWTLQFCGRKQNKILLLDEGWLTSGWMREKVKRLHKNNKK